MNASGAKRVNVSFLWRCEDCECNNMEHYQDLLYSVCLVCNLLVYTGLVNSAGIKSRLFAVGSEMTTPHNIK
jgi:hypothetical protein